MDNVFLFYTNEGGQLLAIDYSDNFISIEGAQKRPITISKCIQIWYIFVYLYR